MGNWRTVHIDGTIDQCQVNAARQACIDSNDVYHALAFSEQGSLCGLNNWPASRISAIGNCYERDFSIEDVAEACRDVIKVAPSFTAKVHCGGEYEDKTCVATITVKDGAVTVDPPEVQSLPEISQAQIMGNLMKAMQR